MEEFSAAGFAEYLDLLGKIFQQGQRSGVFRPELNPRLRPRCFWRARRNGHELIISKRHYKLGKPTADLCWMFF